MNGLSTKTDAMEPPVISDEKTATDLNGLRREVFHHFEVEPKPIVNHAWIVNRNATEPLGIPSVSVPDTLI